MGFQTQRKNDQRADRGDFRIRRISRLVEIGLASGAIGLVEQRLNFRAGFLDEDLAGVHSLPATTPLTRCSNSQSAMS
jgi:hypothetical protein